MKNEGAVAKYFIVELFCDSSLLLHGIVIRKINKADS